MSPAGSAERPEREWVAAMSTSSFVNLATFIEDLAANKAAKARKRTGLATLGSGSAFDKMSYGDQGRGSQHRSCASMMILTNPKSGPKALDNYSVPPVQ